MIELTFLQIVCLVFTGYMLRVCVEEMGEHSQLQDRQSE